MIPEISNWIQALYNHRLWLVSLDNMAVSNINSQRVGSLCDVLLHWLIFICCVCPYSTFEHSCQCFWSIGSSRHAGIFCLYFFSVAMVLQCKNLGPYGNFSTITANMKSNPCCGC